MKHIAKWKFPSQKVNQENKENWIEEFKELNHQLLANHSILNDFWVDVIVQYHIEKQKA